MSVADIKAAIDALSPQELKDVSAHLWRKRWTDSPELKAEMTAIADEMERGIGYSRGDLEQRYESRVAEE